MVMIRMPMLYLGSGCLFYDDDHDAYALPGKRVSIL
jgi:hypothetical protein